MTKYQLEEYFDLLFQITRSIIGEGYRKSSQTSIEVIPFKYIGIEIGSMVLTGGFRKNKMSRANNKNLLN